jgi:hypothetical protein
MTRRTSASPAAQAVVAERVPVAKLAPWRNLAAGDEADVQFAGRKRRTRATFVAASPAGLTFRDPRTGALRYVKPDDVGTIHRNRKLRPANGSNPQPS